MHMSRNHNLWLTLAVLLVSAVLTLPASAQISFGTVDLGEIRTSCVGLCFGTNCDQMGAVQSLGIGAPFSIHGIRRGPANVDLCNNPGASNAVTLPTTIQAGQQIIFDIDLVATDLGAVSKDLLVNGGPQIPAVATVLPAGPCPPSATNALCLQDQRFTVRSNWRTQFGTRGHSPKVQNVNSDDSGLFYFFNPNNWEMLIKVLDGCPVNNRFWVFAAATTNVEYTITVTDTQEQKVSTYFNPLGSAASPIQDTQAFATCP
jgi:hypothetical protein